MKSLLILRLCGSIIHYRKSLQNHHLLKLLRQCWIAIIYEHLEYRTSLIQEDGSAVFSRSFTTSWMFLYRNITKCQSSLLFFLYFKTKRSLDLTLAVQWLRSVLSLPRAQFRSLVGELRSRRKEKGSNKGSPIHASRVPLNLRGDALVFCTFLRQTWAPRKNQSSEDNECPASSNSNNTCYHLLRTYYVLWTILSILFTLFHFVSTSFRR